MHFQQLLLKLTQRKLKERSKSNNPFAFLQCIAQQIRLPRWKAFSLKG